MPPKDPEIAEIKEMLKDIYVAVAGNDKLGIRGINHRIAETQVQVADHEKRLTKVEEDNKKSKWVKLGASLGAGLGSGLAIGSGKASAVISKVLSIAAASIFLFYLIMLFV